MNTAAAIKRRPVDLVTFTVNGEMHALPLEAVDEIISLVTLRDTIDYRGDRIAVRTAEAALGLAVQEGTRHRRGIVVRWGGAHFILAVERVLMVDEVTEGEIIPPPELFGEVTEAIVRGVVSTREGLIVVLEPDALSEWIAAEAAPVEEGDSTDGG